MAEDLSERIGADDDDNVRAFEERMRDRSPVESLRGIVRFLKQIPAADREKKRELAKYFDSGLGRDFTKDERRAAYNELLGESRNARQRG